MSNHHRFIRCPLPFESVIMITDPLVGPLMFHLEKVSIDVWKYLPSGLIGFNIRLNNRYPRAQNMMHLIPKIMVSNPDFRETEVQITNSFSNVLPLCQHNARWYDFQMIPLCIDSKKI